MFRVRLTSQLRSCALVCVFYLFLCGVCGTTSPLSVVVSGSMEPAIYRGDIQLLYKSETEALRVGQIVAYQMPHHTVPIMHRINAVSADGECVMTRGDANGVDDRSLYGPQHPCLKRRYILGRVLLTVPYVARGPLVWLIERPRLMYSLVVGEMLLELLTGWTTLTLLWAAARAAYRGVTDRQS
jgi:signal peptidase